MWKWLFDLEEDGDRGIQRFDNITNRIYVILGLILFVYLVGGLLWVVISSVLGIGV